MRRSIILFFVTAWLLSACLPQVQPTAAPFPTQTPPLAATGQPTPGQTEPVLPSPLPEESEAEFANRVISAVEQRDLAALEGLMADPFILAGWYSEGEHLAVQEAVQTLRDSHLSPGAMPAHKAGMDVTALLEGADPLKIFGQDVNLVRALYFEGIGPLATDEALALVARDPQTGKLFLAGMLVAAHGFQQDEDLGRLNQFGEQLAAAIAEQDWGDLLDMMADQFSIATIDSLIVKPDSEAAVELRKGPFHVGASPLLNPGTDVTFLLNGTDPLSLWGPVAQPVRAVHLQGLGASGEEEAVVVIGRDAETGRFTWHGILLAPEGKFQSVPGPVGDALPTFIRWIIAKDQLNMRSGPGMGYAVEGQMREGEIAQVTGVSPDDEWWQVVCVTDASGRCWVSTDPELTEPTQKP